MEIRLTGELLRLPPAALSPRAWSVGEILNAVVAKATRGGAAQLRIGQHLVTAETQVPLKQGQQLTLRVVESSRRPVLQVLQEVFPNVRDEQIRATALKSALPQQQPAAQTLASLERAVAGPLPDTIQPLKASVEELLSKVPTQQLLRNAPELKRAIADSGVFLEARMQAGLTSPTTPPPADLKSALQRIAAIIRSMPELPAATPQATPNKPAPTANQPIQTPQPSKESVSPATTGNQSVPPNHQQPMLKTTVATPPKATTNVPTMATAVAADDVSAPVQATARLSTERLGREVDSALARIQVNQLISVPVEDGSSQQLWMIEVPVRSEQGFDTLQMVIEREPESGDDQTPGWSLTLSFALQPLGPMIVRLRLINQRIDAGFWAERAPTQQLIANQLTLFSAALSEVGLSPGHLHILDESPLRDINRHLPRGLVSEQV
jgi:hypothetical protein